MADKPHVEFDSRAVRDVDAAVEWYDAQGADLGDQFLDRLDAVIGRLASHPAMYSPIEGAIRRAFLTEFPYTVYYLPEDDRIRVLAVLHTSRRPDYWRKGDE